MFEFFRRYRDAMILLALMTLGMSLLLTNIRSKDALSLPEKGLVMIFAPFQDAIGWVAVSFSTSWENHFALANVQKENRTLKREIARLSFENNALTEQLLTYQRIETLLKATPPESSGTSVVAHVIARDTTARAPVVTINRGYDDGVTEGAVAYTYDGLAGMVITVTRSASKVLLLTDFRSAVDAVAQETRDSMVVEGINGPVLRARYLSITATVAKGDRIVSSGWGGIYPRGMVIGAVASISHQPDSLFLEATITPAVRFDTIEELLVLIPEPPPVVTTPDPL